MWASVLTGSHHSSSRSRRRGPPSGSGCADGPGRGRVARRAPTADSLRRDEAREGIERRGRRRARRSPRARPRPAPARAGRATRSTRGRRHADRPVAILEGGVGLGPGLRRLAQLQRRLVREADGPAVAEERPLRDARWVAERKRIAVSAASASSAATRRRRAGVERLAQQRERSGREARLHDRPLVGERRASIGDAGGARRQGTRRTAVSATVRAATARASACSTSLVVPEREIASSTS